jgi:hypothetical protein
MPVAETRRKALSINRLRKVWREKNPRYSTEPAIKAIKKSAVAAITERYFDV